MVCQVWVGITILENYFVPLHPYHLDGKKEDYVPGRIAGAATLIIPCIRGQPRIKITSEKNSCLPQRCQATSREPYCPHNPEVSK